MRIVKIEEQKDGSAIMQYKLTEAELAAVKKISKKDIMTNDEINEVILQAIKDGIKSESKKEDKKTKSKDRF